jgi:hypothetical protein
MQKVRNLREGLNALLEGNILVYKPYNYKPVFLRLKSEEKITAFNFNMRYSISKKDLEELFQEFNIYIYEQENDIEIDEEFRKLRQ